MSNTSKGEEKPKKKKELLKESTYSLCPIHKIQFPRGADCPRCVQERQ